MAFQQVFLRFLGITAFLTMLTLIDVSSESSLHNILKKRDEAGTSTALANRQSAVALTAPKAKEFLAKLRRPKRNLWDRSRPDVQQWIMQFMYMGFDEQRLETDLAYWMDHWRSSDQGRQHHNDENAPIGPRHPGTYRHGADVNYDYY